MPFAWVGGYLWSQVPSGVGWICTGEGVCAGGWYSPPPQTWDREVGTHSPILTPSGSHHTYDQHAGSTHPTGMLSC